MSDSDVWPQVDPNYLWIFDKLILARKLGYVCGPAGVNVPQPDNYIVRPITNIEGMGRGAEVVWLEDDTSHLTPGMFWCEVFTGQHLSIDYVNQNQVLCVLGVREPGAPLYKWERWVKVDNKIPFPDLLKDLPYENINVETIDGNIIEVHLRLNPDFDNDYAAIFPVWEGESTVPPPGYKFKDDRDYKRLGFFVPLRPQDFFLASPAGFEPT